MKAGRPSAYNKKYCEEIIACLSGGHSIAGFAGKIGRCKDTVFEWLKKYPEFAEAAKIATTAAVYYWECRLIAVANGEKVEKSAVTAIIFGLKNRAHEDWRDVNKVEHTGADGGPVTFKTVYEAAA